MIGGFTNPEAAKEIVENKRRLAEEGPSEEAVADATQQKLRQLKRGVPKTDKVIQKEIISRIAESTPEIQTLKDLTKQDGDSDR